MITRKNNSAITARRGVLMASAVSVALLSACSSDNNSSSSTDTSTRLAFAATNGGGSGQIERLSISGGYESTGTYPGTVSDIVVDTDGNNVYQIARSTTATVTRFDPTDTSIVDFQFKVNGDEVASNPYDIVFASETKAYIIRYDSPKVWIVNPSAIDEADFKTGELDLSAYDADAAPNADSGVIVGNKLFILMQRLTEPAFVPDKPGYVAVFDVDTDTEIDTGLGSNGLKGIELSSVNPSELRYNSVTDELYVTGRGNLYVQYNMLPGDPYQGALEAIDADTFALSTMMDDGDETTNQGFISRTLVVGDTNGYVQLYSGDDENFNAITALHGFNPSTGIIGDAVAALAGVDVTSITKGPDGNIWFGHKGDTPGFTLLNPTDNSVVREVPTSGNPVNVVFVSTP